MVTGIVKFEELVLMGTAVPRLERELITDHSAEPGYNPALLQVIQFHLFSILASLLIPSPTVGYLRRGYGQRGCHQP